MKNIKLSIIFPVRNEGTNIEILVPFIKAAVNISYEMLIVCDSEKDSSIDSVKKLKKTHPGLKLIII